MFTRAAICFVLLLLGGAAFAESSANRVALVIGNAAYRRAMLANPVNDARLMASKLKAQGFQVFEFYDSNQREMKRAVQSFATTLRERGKDVVAFIFYAGHGVQVKGENYLIPVDEQIRSEADVDIDAVSLSSIMSMLENTETRLSIVVLDACRDNPFGYARGGQRGLARVDAPSGSLVAFSTAPGKAAPDGPVGGNSYYTAALAQALGQSGLKIEEVFKKVRIAVREQTHNEQTPWESTSLTGDFYPAGERLTSAATAQAEPPPAKPLSIAAAKPEPLRTPSADMPAEDRASRLVRTIAGHTGVVKSAFFAGNDVTALSGSWDQTLRLWDLRTGQESRTFAVQSDVNAVAISTDGAVAISGSDDRKVTIWDVATGKVLRSLEGHRDRVTSVVFSPDRSLILSGSDDKTLKIWDAKSGNTLRTFQNSATPWSIAISSDGTTATWPYVDEIRVWSLTSGREVRLLSKHSATINSVAFSPNGRFVLSGGNDKLIVLWDVSTGERLRTFSGHTGEVEAVAVSPGGDLALSGSKDKTIKLWDLASGRELHSFSGHDAEVLSVAFSRDGQFALSGSADRTLKLWDLSEWTQPREARR